ncbi:BTAD domain-containing putative transcriptional regulator [Streptomyces sp. AS02]|uniref:BTAD domain-containing putative transcriptional regulator n=1 Tax=Streptomyces sp. AS02 TaxID=2938946 RepID=UPI0020215CF2|nr:BTAD domain-containing putative transcriptional regulator [Streptomyces sp. AS02]MCL8014270.1 AAA family ATPase [Streptomyces sp. AS02]
MEFRVLGPLEVVHEGRPVELRGTKQRGTLGCLLLQANRVVPTSRLLNALWPDDNAPTTARKILQNAVYGLRGVLSSGPDDAPGAATLLTQPPGYMLRVAPEQVDLHLFHRWVGEGRDKRAQGAPAEAAVLLRDALDLWRGSALADLVEAGIEWPELASLQNTRLDVTEDYFDAQLSCGRHHAVLAELETMVAAEPLRERSCGQLMLALYRCGRQADALNVFSRVRSLLIENLGLEPGHAIQELQRAILTQDPLLSLDPAPARSEPVRMTTVPRQGTRSEPVGPSVTRTEPPRPETGHRPAERTGAPAEARAEAAPQHTGMQRRLVTVVSVRTRLTPSLGDGAGDGVDDLLDAAVTMVRGQVERHGGTVTASMGSVTQALFGLDGPDDAGADQAVPAALAIRDVLEMRGGCEPGPAPLSVRASVMTGEVLLRYSGKDDAPTAVGAVLDESQCLLSDMTDGQVLVSDTVRRATEDTVSYRPADARPSYWLAVGHRAARQQTGAEDPETAYELDLLCGLARRSRERGIPHVVTVLGESGAGKSRLLREFGSRLGSRPGAAAVLTGRTPAAPTEHPLKAQAQILAAYCGIRPGDDPESARSALDAQVRFLFRSDRTARRIGSSLMPLLDARADAAASAVPAAETLAAWRDFFQEAAQHQAVVLCVDDLHRADTRVLDVVEELAESAGPVPLFVVVSASPELLLRRPAWAGGKSHATTLSLGRAEEATTSRQLVEFLRSAARELREVGDAYTPAAG